MKKVSRVFNKTNAIALAVALVLSLAVFFGLYLFKSKELYDCINYSFLIGAVVFLLSLFILIVNLGMFDLMAVGFANLFSAMKKNGTKKYDGLFDYTEQKSAKRKGNRFIFLPVLVVGSAFIILSIILRTIWISTL